MDSLEISDSRLEHRIAALIEPTLVDMGYEVVRIMILGKVSLTLQIMVDRADGSLINVEDCEQISHAVSAIMDVEDPIEAAWTLEVSSAGIDRPLVRPKDWNRFSGHLAKAETMIPVESRRRFSGVVLGADDAFARMRLDDGVEVALPFSEIRKAKLVLTDALIDACQHMITPSKSEAEESVEEDTQHQSSGFGENNRFKTH
ncbi:ribosome maturation factor RimP [Commensalibacter papalotli (ex Botero et al. 2024)]|uniref:Ribosome maturation factor RimP n=1 Tax=Commensalibacter papalotli (ex Botero et al. 2024) TaxID=2972766 RepID=A0ABN8WGA8_9PROT|nr:ribosome maturation factor RimP [Commensalibacter papalotli (ex Botero et al. 2024)]CAI3943274.1 Ribosome maturation factor RimP (RimP) (PDB:1IB8) [Commensalibacter papalotli (ex Botero et al. 2024)]CAI3947624.1 Ribosome maturation factor RimP (RimP) (PDB:1IB8) [Commensalibacter papalotli (ex Botero et al. 2024)]